MRSKSTRFGKIPQKLLHTFDYDAKKHIEPIKKTIEEATEMINKTTQI